jgi:hypothetical protein
MANEKLEILDTTELRRLRAAVFDGKPWTGYTETDGSALLSIIRSSAWEDEAWLGSLDGPHASAALAFILYVAYHAPGICDRIEALEAESKRLRTALEGARAQMQWIADDEWHHGEAEMREKAQEGADEAAAALEAK